MQEYLEQNKKDDFTHEKFEKLINFKDEKIDKELFNKLIDLVVKSNHMLNVVCQDQNPKLKKKKGSER